jgi:hypothetical protein
MGYEDIQIIHRLDINLTEQQNRRTNPVKFIDKAGTLVYEQKPLNSELPYATRNTTLGRGYIGANGLVNKPFDFSIKNRLSLTDLHGILRSVIFPEETTGKMKFNLRKDDYTFLYKYMSMFPRESTFPFYDSIYYHDSYVKFLLCGKQPAVQDGDIRIFNKVGDAYGFLTDAAYIVDFRNKIEFMLTATIYCNADGIFNDDKYDYDTIGFPFLKNLGQVIYEYELKRQRPGKPDLSSFWFNYSVD